MMKPTAANSPQAPVAQATNTTYWPTNQSYGTVPYQSVAVPGVASGYAPPQNNNSTFQASNTVSSAQHTYPCAGDATGKNFGGDLISLSCTQNRS